MSRLAKRFADLKAEGRTALVPFMTAGDPDKETTVPVMHALVEAGASVLELGVPFSDPMADGPTIQKASERALEHHTSLHDVLGMVAEFRKKDNDTPVVLMGYLNPVEIMGYEAFARQAAEAGVDGVLTVDMPPEETEGFGDMLRAEELDPIFLIAPTSTDDRIQSICDTASGFVYYVSLKGVTGAANLDVDSVREKMDQIRQHTDLPVGVGFGIKDAATAARVSAVADAVVVGSAIVNMFEEHAGDTATIISKTAGLVSEMRTAMDA